MSRRTAMAGATVAVVVLIGGTAIFLRPRAPTERSPVAERAPAASGDVVSTPLRVEQPSLLYLVGGSLRAVDLDSGRTRRLGELSADVATAAPRGTWVAEVVPLDPPSGGERDFVADPELRLLDIASGRESRIGPGFAPLWGPDGDSLVFLRPVGPRRCSGDVCRGRSAVVALDVATGNTTTLLAAGRWGILSWLGHEVLVSDGRDLERAVAVSLDGRARRLSLAPSEVWAGSPDGEWLVAVRGGRPTLQAVGGAAANGRVDRITTGRGVLAAGAWAPDSSLVAAVVVGAGFRERPAVFGPAEPDPVPLRGVTGATGPVMWSEDASVFVVPARGHGKQHVSVCVVEQRSCSRLMPYRRNVSLVGIVGG